MNTASTLGYFKKVFGEKRVFRLEPFAGCATVESVKRLFVSAGEVTFLDMEELFLEIKSDKKTVRALSESETVALRGEFQQTATLEACSTSALLKLYQLLNPFQSTKDLFCNQVPELKLPVYALSQKMRVLMYERMRREPSTERMWIIDMAKVLADLEMPKGTILRTPKGNFCTVHEIIRGGGAYKYLLRTIGKAVDEEGNFLLNRGTRPLPNSTDWWKTIIEDFRLRLGSKGSEETFVQTRDLLKTPFFEGKRLTAIGNSLGGVHAQYDALLHTIHRVVTVVSPGIDAKYAALAATRPTTEVQHIIEAEDFVDQLGEVHFGAGVDPKKMAVSFHILQPGKQASPDLNTALGLVAKVRKMLSKPVADLMRLSFCPKTFTAAPRILLHIAKTMLQAHTRHTVLQEHFAIDLNNRTHGALLQAVLTHGSPLTDRRWEELRKVVPKILSKL